MITANKKTRLSRAIKRHNISLEDIQNRIALQMSESQKKNIADYIIDNNYSLNNLFKKLEILHIELLK